METMTQVSENYVVTFNKYTQVYTIFKKEGFKLEETIEAGMKADSSKLANMAKTKSIIFNYLNTNFDLTLNTQTVRRKNMNITKAYYGKPSNFVAEVKYI